MVSTVQARGCDRPRVLAAQPANLEVPLPLGSPLIHPLPVTGFTGAQQREVCDLLRNRLTKTRRVFFTPVTIEAVWLEGQDDDFTLVVALTQKDRPQVHYKLRMQLADWHFAKAGLPETSVGGWAVWLQEAIAEAVDAAPGLPLPSEAGTVVVDLD